MDKLRMGLIGAGNIAQTAHLPAYARRDDVEVVAIADLCVGRARAAADRFGVPGAYDSVETLLAAEQVDAIDVCVPNRAHAPVSIAGARAGKHVLCEKPLAGTMEEALAIEAAVRAAGVTFMLAVPRRYQADVRLLAAKVEAGELGEIYYAKTGNLRRRGTPVGWFTDTARSGGGPVLDIGVHCIDRCWYLMGRPRPTSVCAATAYHIGDFASASVERWTAMDPGDGTFDTEDSAAGFVRFENGACMLFETSWALNGPNRDYTEIFGTRGGASLGPLTLYGEADGFLTDTRPATIDIDRFHYEIGHFVACVREGRTPVSSLEDAVTLQRILDGVYASAKAGREIML